MDQPKTPFSQTELLPQEEMLEIAKSKGKLFIGIPKERSYQEKRVCLTPDAVAAITAHGHRVMVESKAGEDSNFSDRDYSEAGAKIIHDIKKVFACPLILKVEPPTLAELELINPQTTLISALQLKTQEKSYFKTLAKKRITALAFEFIKDHEGNYPAVRTLSEIAGTASILIASELLAGDRGSGLMFGNISGVPPLQCVILGAGTVGEFAARSALGLGAGVKFFDHSLFNLRRVQTRLNQPLYTSTIQPKTLLKSLKKADVVIGAIRGKKRAPVIISEPMVSSMKKGAVVIDVSIDMGGCFETSEITSHDHPTITKNGVIHYGVPNIPSRYPRTSSISISNIFTPYLLHIGEEGGLENTLRFDHSLRNGLYFYHGILTNKAVADWFDMQHSDINLLIF